MQDHSEHLRAAAESFLPHGFCYLWNPPLLWTHVVSDLLIGFAYVAISFSLAFLVWKGRNEFPFQRMFLAFGLFIVACGATHFVEIWTLWRPDYWFSAGVKVVTAAASVGTALLLPPLVPVVIRTAREARHAEERRVQAESAERFRLLAEALPQIVWTATPDGAVDYYNRRWMEYTGIPVDDGHGWGWRVVVHPDDAERTTAAWEHAVRTGEPYEVTHRIRARDGSYRWLLSRSVPVRDGEGRITRWLGTATDIDAQKQAEEALRAAKEEAEHAVRAKDQFLAVMSHELRTPLNAIMGYTDLLGAGVMGPVTPKHEEAFSRIRTSTGHLLGLIDQVLTFSRIEAGHAAPSPELVPVAQVVDAASALTEPLAAGKGLAFQVQNDAGDLEIQTDSGMLRQILLNLLSNAVKFTDQGEVVLRARVEGGDLLLSVTDTGAGIPAEYVQKIFQPFWQADQSFTRRAEGTGLGLSVTERLVQALGGSVAVKSAVGHGTTFIVRLPVRPAPRAGVEA